MAARKSARTRKAAAAKSDAMSDEEQQQVDNTADEQQQDEEETKHDATDNDEEAASSSPAFSEPEESSADEEEQKETRRRSSRARAASPPAATAGSKPKKAAAKSKAKQKAAEPASDAEEEEQKDAASHDDDSDELGDVVSELPPARKRKSPTAGRTKAGSSRAGSRKAKADDDDVAAAVQTKSKLLAKDDPDMGKLYKAIILSNTATKVTARTWVQQYQADNTHDRAIAELTTLLVQIAGSTAKFTSDEIVNEDEITLINKAQEYIRTPCVDAEGAKRTKRIETRMRDFWFKLVETGSVGPIYDDVLTTVISRWLGRIGSSQMRQFRQIATHNAVSFMDSLCSLAVSSQQRLNTSQQQAAAAKTAELKRQLRADIQKQQERIQALQAAIKQLFETVFLHRYRDVDASIRQATVNGLGHWITLYPAMFLQDTYLKYVGWMLSDKDVQVRKHALIAISAVYDNMSEEVAAKLATFTERFKRRFNEMTNDHDAHVAALAVNTMTLLLKAGMLSENDGENVPSLVWDKEPAVRASAAAFVFEDTFSDTQSDNASIQQLQEDITQLLNIFDRYCPLVYRSTNKKSNISLHALAEGNTDGVDIQTPMSMIVGVMSPLLNAVQNIDCITSMIVDVEASESSGGRGRKQRSALTNTVGKLDDDRQLLVLNLLLSASKAILSEASAKSGRFGREATVDEAVEKRQLDTIVSLITTLPALLSQYSTDATKLKVVLQLLPLIPSEQYATLRKKHEFQQTLAQLKAIYHKHSDVHLLGYAAMALRQLNKADYQYAEEALTLTNDLVSELLTTLRDIVDGTTTFTTENAKEVELLSILRRLSAISRQLQFEELRYDRLNIDTLANEYVEDHSAANRQRILLAILDLQNQSLTWQWFAAAAAGPQTDADALTELHTALNSSVTRLQQLLISSDSFTVSDTTYRYLGDIFSMFNANAPVTFSKDQLLEVQQTFNTYFSELMSGKDNEERMEELGYTDSSESLASMRLIAVRTATAPIFNDIDPQTSRTRHRQLASSMLSHYTRWGGETDELIKMTINQMKKTLGVLELMVAQLGALQTLYRDFAEESFIKNLANKFSLLLAFAKDVSFIQFFREGMSFALRDAPSNLSFLLYLEPYMQRASARDLRAVSAHFQTMAAGVEDDARRDKSDEYEPLQSFKDALKKSLSKRADKEGPGGRAAAPTPRSALETPSARTPTSVTGMLTPIAPSTAGMSAVPSRRLQPVLESDVESVADEGESKAPTAASRKRGRGMELEEDEQSASDAAEEENIPPARSSSNKRANSGTRATKRSKPPIMEETVDEEEEEA